VTDSKSARDSDADGETPNSPVAPIRRTVDSGDVRTPEETCPGPIGAAEKMRADNTPERCLLWPDGSCEIHGRHKDLVAELARITKERDEAVRIIEHLRHLASPFDRTAVDFLSRLKSEEKP